MLIRSASVRRRYLFVSMLWGVVWYFGLQRCCGVFVWLKYLWSSCEVRCLDRCSQRSAYFHELIHAAIRLIEVKNPPI